MSNVVLVLDILQDSCMIYKVPCMHLLLMVGACRTRVEIGITYICIWLLQSDAQDLLNIAPISIESN